MKRIQVIDSHTGGEPTRVVIRGGPELGGGGAADKLKVFRERHDDFRRAVVCEPRGSDVLVGALLVEPADKSCVAGVIYFDNVTFLGMCGHGTIGLVVTLAHLGRIQPGEHRIETPVGVVTAVLNGDGSVSLTNIPAYRKAKGATIDAPGLGKISGDVAWGGNWFFLVEEHGLALDLANVERLTDASWRVRQAVNAQGFPEVDHIVLFGPPRTKDAHSQNFVLCPGKAYDRSPCGTGTSARLACLAADGRLAEGESLVMESIVGSRFTGRYRWLDPAAGTIIPTITGTAHVTGEAGLILNERDPFCWGW
ncbi:MAG: proline racemase family protein [Verrucomicrobia bacterium]|nr:proline racemase family protein [Verrucomicrobiota bacterium]